MFTCLRTTSLLVMITYGSIGFAELPHHAEVHTFQATQADIAADTPDFGVFVGFGGAVATRSGIAAIAMTSVGRVALYERRGTVWTRTTTLTAPETTSGFGAALAVRDNTLVVGGSEALYVYKRVSGAWRYRQKITPPTSDDVGFLTDSIRYQDNLVIAGAVLRDAPGAIYIFQLSEAGTLLKRTRLQAQPSAMGSEFGSDVAMSSEAIVVGAPGENDYRGAAYVFRRSSTGWRQSQRLLAREGIAGDRFGTAVAINNGIVVVGAPQADPFGEFGEARGAAYVFVPSNGRHVQNKRLQPAALERSQYQNFGFDIEMSLDRIAIAGRALFDEDRYPPAGHVITFRRSSAGITPIGVAEQDAAVESVSFDRNMLLLGVPFEWRCFDRNRCIGSATFFDVSRTQ